MEGKGEIESHKKEEEGENKKSPPRKKPNWPSPSGPSPGPLSSGGFGGRFKTLHEGDI